MKDGRTKPAGTTLSASGTVSTDALSLSTGFINGSYPSLTGVANTGATFVAVYNLQDGTAQGDRLSAALDAPVPLTLSGNEPVIGSDAHGFGVAVSAKAPTLPEFYAFAADGSKDCGPVTIADADFVPAAVVPTENGYLIASS